MLKIRLNDFFPKGVLCSFMEETSIIAIYNGYAKALEEFGFENLSLELLYISPEEDLSFLTISDGEIIYDVFDEAA